MEGDHDLISQSVKYAAICRTAPPTPGLVIIASCEDRGSFEWLEVQPPLKESVQDLYTMRFGNWPANHWDPESDRGQEEEQDQTSYFC